jgi:hypothetical protein
MVKSRTPDTRMRLWFAETVGGDGTEVEAVVVLVVAATAGAGAAAAAASKWEGGDSSWVVYRNAIAVVVAVGTTSIAAAALARH